MTLGVFIFAIDDKTSVDILAPISLLTCPHITGSRNAGSKDRNIFRF